MSTPKPFGWGQVCVEFSFLNQSIVVTAVFVAVFFTAIFVAAVFITAIFVLLNLVVVLSVFHKIFSFLRKTATSKTKSVIVERLQKANANRRNLVPLYKEDKFSKLPLQRAYDRIRCKSKGWGFRSCTAYYFSRRHADIGR